MGSTFKSSVYNCILGMLLAAAGWCVWWLASLALGASVWGPSFTILPAIGVGAVSAILATVLTARRDQLAVRHLRQHLTLKGSNTQPPCPAWARPIVEEFHALDRQLQAQRAEAGRQARRKRRRHPLDRPGYLVHISDTMRLQKVSTPLARLLQSAKDRLIGTSILSRLHPDDAAAVQQAFTQARETRRVQHVLCRFLLVGGTAAQDQPVQKLSPSDTEELPAFNPQALIYARLDVWAGKDYFIGKLLDLTPIVADRELELQSTRRALAKVKKRWQSLGQDLHRLKLSYRELYQYAPVMYFSMDSAGRLVTFNDTLIRTLGYERLELQGKEYTALLAPATLKSYVAIAGSMPSHEGELETQWRKKDGTVIDVWLHSVPVYDEDGRFVRYRSAALDLSEKNQLANELRARGDELERTNHSLRAINSELEAFTHVVSHDLKEPLRTLQAYSHLLAEEHAAQLGPDGFQYVNHLVRASRRLGTLIDELLKLSQAGRITLAAKAFNLTTIVATVRQDLVDLLQREDAAIVTDGSLPDVIGDPVRVTQLLTNLVANGLKYNQNPQPRVTIGSMPCADDPGRATIYVRDNGIGIDPAFHQQIFGIFRRLHQDGQYEGTGAGLAICKKIVEGHGGHIWIESQVGQGATFYFTLARPPGVRVAASGNGKPSSATPKAVAPPPPAEKRKTTPSLGLSNGATATPKIVLVEDQADVGLVIQKLGKRDGLNIAWFPTAEDAWRHLEFERVDLLLLDINLPGMNGLELCDRLHKLPHFKDTLVAMFTPGQDAEHLQALRAAGGDFFLTKDLLCEPAAWQRKIQELLKQIRKPAPH